MPKSNAKLTIQKAARILDSNGLTLQHESTRLIGGSWITTYRVVYPGQGEDEILTGEEVRKLCDELTF